MLLVLKTGVRRTALIYALFLTWTPVASAWSWPLEGPVLRPYSYDETQPYAAGQHRGIDIGAGAAGQTVTAPAAGTIAFAGTVPTNGQSVTIATADGYSVTLTHLGSIVVRKGEPVAERDPIGTTGPSGAPELAGPYVHLGIRVTADPNGYVDPLGLLPPAATGGATDSGSTASQPSSNGATSTSSSASPASEPVAPSAAAPTVAASQGSTAAHARRSDVRVHESKRAQEARVHVEAPRTAQPIASQAAPRRPLIRPTSSSRQPDAGTAASVGRVGLGTGHEPRSGIEPAEVVHPRPQAPGMSLALAFNGAAALVALGAAFAAGRRRRVGSSSVATAQVLRLPEPVAAQRRAA